MSTEKNNKATREVILGKEDKRVAYKAEGRRRMDIRKKKRLAKFTENRERKDKWKCRGCGEDPYCYCGDGTPYSY